MKKLNCQPRLVAVSDCAGHVLTQPGIRKATPSQRAYLRAASASQDYRLDACDRERAYDLLRADRARRDRLCFLQAADEPAPRVDEDLLRGRRLPLDHPMATLHVIDSATVLLARGLAWVGGLALLALAWGW